LYEDLDSLRSIAWIRFAQFYCVSVKPPAAKPCAIFPTFAKENNPQKTRVLLFVSPLRVFSFALFGLLASGSALFGSPVPRWFCLCGGVVRVPWAFLFLAVFLCLLWLAFAVRVLCRRRFRRWFLRAFRRLRAPIAVSRSAALRALMLSFVGLVRRRLCFRLRLLVSGAVRSRVGRRLWFRRSLLPVAAAVWLRLFLPVVRSVWFLPLRLRGAFPVSVRVRGLRLLLRSGAAFRLWFFLASVRALRLARFCLFRGRVLGFPPVPVFGRRAFVSCLLRRPLCLSKPLFFLCLTRYLLDFSYVFSLHIIR
jgi:hypothetical protein